MRWNGLRFEQGTRAAEAMRLVIDAIPTMAWTGRPDGVVDFVNQSWLDYTGLSFDEEIAEPTRAVHPEAYVAAGESFENEMRLRQADGEYRWFLVRTSWANVHLSDGTTIAVGLDITGVKGRKKRYRNRATSYALSRHGFRVSGKRRGPGWRVRSTTNLANL